MAYYGGYGGNPDRGVEPQADPTRWVTFRSGTLSFAYVVHHFIALFWYPAAFFVFWFGVGGTLTDPAEAYTEWEWWRIYGAAFALFVLPFIEYWLLQERKVAFTGGPGRLASYNRGTIQVVFFIYMAMIVIIGLWLALLTVWVGVEDFGDCVNSPLCSGPSMGSSPSTGAIMLLTGLCAMTFAHILLLIGGIYVHAAARDAYNARMAVSFPIANEIGGEMDMAGTATGQAVPGQLQL